jgi:hypothetical protein
MRKNQDYEPFSKFVKMVFFVLLASILVLASYNGIFYKFHFKYYNYFVILITCHTIFYDKMMDHLDSNLTTTKGNSAFGIHLVQNIPFYSLVTGAS